VTEARQRKPAISDVGSTFVTQRRRDHSDKIISIWPFSCTTNTLPPLPTTHVFDAFRTAIAKRVADALPLTLEQAYAGVDYGKKGVDFTIALPRFRLPGKMDELVGKSSAK